MIQKGKKLSLKDRHICTIQLRKDTIHTPQRSSNDHPGTDGTPLHKDLGL